MELPLPTMSGSLEGGTLPLYSFSPPFTGASTPRCSLLSSEIVHCLQLQRDHEQSKQVEDE